MRRSRFSLAATLATLLATAPLAMAQEPTLLPSEAADAARRAKGRTYIVQLTENPAVAYEGGLYGLAATRPAKGQKIQPDTPAVRQYVAHLTARHDDVVSAVGGRKLHSYCYTFNGFAASLSPAQVSALKQRSDVVQVWQDELMQPTTNTSPAFLGLDGKKGVWDDEKLLGEDIVVGVIDTGIWPEHESFADAGCPPDDDDDGDDDDDDEATCKYKYKPKVKPSKLNKEQTKAARYDALAAFASSGCDFGNAGFNLLDAPFACNNKLLAARYYAGGFSTPGTTNPDGSGGDGAALIASEYLSARDNDGHGSHTGSTAAGNLFVPASIGGSDLGRVSGMAPRARVAAYKVCWNGSFPPAGFQGGCFSSDSMAAIDQAVADGVDVINFSIGGSSTNFNGPDDIAFLFAADAGVFVATSAGNDGPGAQTIGTPSGVPWITAVGAAQDDQVFGTGLDVSSPSSIADTYEGLEGAGPVTLESTGNIAGSVVPSEPADGCTPLTNAAAINTNLALVIRGACSFSTKYDSAAAAGATAIVVYNDGTDPTRVDPITMSAPGTSIPGIMIGFFDGDAIATAATGGATVTGTVGPSIVVSKENTIAGFSSRGPNGGAPDIIKPDIAAPGVQILAAQTPTPNDGQTPGELFQIISGTSMASPHAAGIGALLLQEHPDWTPAMVRSALMTTARQDLNKTFGDAPADPFDIGAGHIVPSKAVDPGLVYDADLFDYVRFTCGSNEQPQIFTQGTCDFFGGIDSSDLNLPSIGVAELAGTQTITRTVTSVRKGGKRTWSVSVDPPPGIDVNVTPSALTLKNGESASYQVQLTTDGAALDEWSFGSLTWSDAKKKPKKKDILARSPIAVKPVALSAPETVIGSGDSGSLDYDVSIGFDGAFSATAEGLVAAEVQPDSVGVGGATLHFVFIPPGTRYARFALFDSNVGDGSGSDDLDMQVQGPDSAGFPFVAFSGSATSEEEINLVDPTPGFYAVFVIHFATVNPTTAYDLFFWPSGPDAGNLTVTAPTSVSVGTETIGLSWSGLSVGEKYLGGVRYGNAGGDIGRSVVRIDP